jgi:predicted GNAT superfamily acetyltransferase
MRWRRCRRPGPCAQPVQRSFRTAARAGHDVVVCEVNSDPPNPGSETFAAFGLSHVGEAKVHGGKKAVRYFARQLEPAKA